MVEAVSGRDQIRNELIAFAQSYIDNWDQYGDKEFQSSEYGFDFVSRQTEYNGNILTIAKASVPGFTLEMHRNFRDNIPTMIPKLDDRVTIVECPPVDGLKCVL